MPIEAIPETVRRLIAERIDSVPELEAILLLREEHDRNWSAEEAGRRLYVSSTSAAYVLARLAQRGILASEGARYHYAPETPGLATAIDQLSAAYTSDLIAITNMIHAKPSASVREFADAFRIRKDK